VRCCTGRWFIVVVIGRTAGAACGGGGRCREMQLGDAKLGDEGDKGKEAPPLEPHVWAVVGVERCNLGMQADLGDEGDEGKEPSSLGPCVWERMLVSRDATWGCKSWRRG
jgi:hypothetical protein